MFHVEWLSTAVFVLDLIIRLGLSVRVIMRRLSVGVSLAWLVVILVFPLVGSFLYLLVGEARLGRREKIRKAAFQIHKRERVVATKAVQSGLLSEGHPEPVAIARLAESVLGSSILHGNRLELLANADAAFPALIADVDRAQRVCCFEFYIWSNGGRADDVGSALIRAASRGVDCRVLVDAVGSADFLRGGLAQQMRQAGVQIRAALPVGLFRVLSVRPDLRMHRKIVVIDDAGYTGSLNIADPVLFKKDAGVGQWVDAFVRVGGPIVPALAATFQEDWASECEGTIDPLHPNPDAPPLASAGQACVQVLPSGPDERVEAIGQLVLMTVYAATEELVLTTPYFVPSESLETALLSAAARGVQVTLIVPARIDSKLVHYASRSYQVNLLAAGVRIALFQGGLLHTKSITIDGRFSLFGSLNLDPRSMRLDFEISLAVYDAEFTKSLRRLQQSYVERSEILDLAACRARSALERFAEDAARLVGPLL